MADTIPGAPAAKTNPATVSPPAPGGQPVVPAVARPASETVAKFGGLKGGRKREDGLIPGTPEAVEADKKKDRERKAAARSVAQRITQPPPLPSATARPGSLVTTIESAPEPTPGALATQPSPEGELVVPWRGADLDTSAALLVEVWEESRLLKRERQCKEARLPASDTREIVEDSKFPDKAKKGLVASSGEVVATGLNAAGVSAKYKHVPLFITSLAMILQQDARQTARMNKLIEAVNKPTSQPGQSPQPAKP